MTVAFVDKHRGQFGVEFIRTQLQVAPSTCYAANGGSAPRPEPFERGDGAGPAEPLWVAKPERTVPTSCGGPPAAPDTERPGPGRQAAR